MEPHQARKAGARHVCIKPALRSTSSVMIQSLHLPVALYSSVQSPMVAAARTLFRRLNNIVIFLRWALIGLER